MNTLAEGGVQDISGIKGEEDKFNESKISNIQQQKDEEEL